MTTTSLDEAQLRGPLAQLRAVLIPGRDPRGLRHPAPPVRPHAPAAARRRHQRPADRAAAAPAGRLRCLHDPLAGPGGGHAARGHASAPILPCARARPPTSPRSPPRAPRRCSWAGCARSRPRRCTGSARARTRRGARSAACASSRNCAPAPGASRWPRPRSGQARGRRRCRAAAAGSAPAARSEAHHGCRVRGDQGEDRLVGLPLPCGRADSVIHR